MAFLTVLSLLVSFAVPFSLIMPAISMTNENGTEQGYFDTNQIANNINYVSEPPSSHPGALDISTANSNFSVGAYNGRNPLDYEIQEDKINATFELEFEFGVSGEDVYVNSLLNGQKFMYLKVSDIVDQTKFILKEEDKTGPTIDSEYTNKTGKDSGTYTITDDGYIIIELTDEYIDYLGTSKILGGALSFSGELSRKNDEDGDQKFTFGNEEVTVQFKDKYPTISKNGKETEPKDGTITWEIIVNNSTKSDLSQYTLTDTMFSSAKDVTIEPSSAGNFSNGTFTFTQDSQNSDSIKITYKTPISEYGKSVKNDAKLKKGDYESPSSKDVYIEKAIDVAKKGNADYENGGNYNQQINWTIEITPKHGQSLDNYEIMDSNFPSDLSKITVSPAGRLVNENGKIVLKDTTNGEKVTLKYTTNAEVGADNKNNVTVTPPGGTPEPDEDTVHYNSKSDFYNLTKEGSYDEDTHLVKWTIKVSSTNTSLNGYKLVDAGFANAVDGKFYANWTNNEFKDYSLSGSTMTLSGDSKNVEFYYYTKVTKEEASKGEVSNKVDFKDPKDDPVKDPDPTKVVVKEFRDTLYKNVANHGESTVYSNGTIKQDIGWNVNIVYDDELAGKVYKDTLSVTGGNGATHTITQEQLNAMEVYAGVKSGNKEKLTLGTDYDVSLNGTEFTVTFKDTDKVKNSNYVDMTYKTTATAGSAFTTYEFKNSGSGFGDGNGNSGSHSINRVDPNVDNKTNIHIGKNWNDNNQTSERPSNIKVRVMYQTKTGNGQLTDWKPLKGSGENYLFDGDSGYAGASEYTLTLTGGNWTADISNLPMEKAKPKADGTKGESTYYYYKIEEIEQDGKPITNGYFNTANGLYQVTNSYGSNQSNANQTLNVTNTFYKNIDITANKKWSNDEGFEASRKDVTIELWRSTDQNNWDNKEVIDTKTLSSSNWSYQWSNLPSAGIVNNNLVKYYYKIVETKCGDTIIDANNKVVITENGYYQSSFESSSSNQDATLEIENTFNKTENLTISAEKIWNDKDINGKDYSGNRPEKIILALQRTTGNGKWELVDEQTLSVNGDSQSYSWSNGLVSQYIDNATGKITKYKYRVVEVGYVYDGKEYRLPENSTAFATTDDGTYEGTYKIDQWSSGNELNKSGNVEITNTFEPMESMEITPQKKWLGDYGEFISNRPGTIKLRLQQKTKKTNWKDMKDSSGNIIEVELKSGANDISESAWDDNSNEYFVVTWQGETISNLPKKKITCEETTDDSGKIIRTYKTESYYYRFVEVFDGNVLEDGDSFKVQNGKYDVTLGKEMDYTGDFLVTNTFKESIGVVKTALDPQGTPIKSIDKEDLLDKEIVDENGNVTGVTKSPYKKTINGVEYYVFNYLIELESKNIALVTPVLDTLPEGFTLVEDNTVHDDSWYKQDEQPISGWGAYCDLNSPFDNKTNPNANTDTYYLSPCILWLSDRCQNTLGDYIKRVSQIYDEMTMDARSSNGAWDHVKESPSRYYYDKDANQIYFGIPRLDESSVPVFTYSIKIKCEDLEARIEKGSYTILNNVKMYDNDGKTPTGKEDNASLTIVNKVPSELITKDYVGPSKVPGYINFALDINPEGKDLSNGDTIDIEDIFRTDSYFDSDWADSKKIRPQLDTGSNLVDVLMNNITIYKVDINGNETKLSANDYQIQFDSKADGVNSKEGEQGAALLKLTIPDETHIRIEYQYKLIANTKTPSVINGCISSTKVGKYYVKMAPGLVPPEGDKITFTNKANLYSDSASADDSVNKQEYEVSRSNAITYANKLPKVKKVNTGNADITNLQAKFLLAKYDQSNQKWLYATKITKGEKITEWSEGVTGLNVAEGAVKINVNTGYSDEFSLEQDALYKLIEVEVPDGYEGSNLGLSKDEFTALIIDYLNGSTANMDIALYETFLNNYVHTHYFVYNSVLTSYPDGINKDDVIQVKNGDDVKIPNNELIDLGVVKNWNDKNRPDATIDVKLYWSYTKASVGIPANATLATAEDLGLIDENFSAVKTIKSGTNEKVWTDLPNGKNGKPIYYYIKETAYSIDGVKYTLIEDEKNPNYGKYMSGDEEGKYMPTYVGNAANSDTNIKVNNSSQLMLKKLWKTSSNNPLSESKIPTDEITVSIYGVNEYGVQTEEPIFEDIVLEKENNWQLDISRYLTEDIDLSQYKSFKAEESGFDTDDYVISCVFNLNENTGEITVTNKNINATEASVTVNKVWSDGADVHKNESIKVSLYQSETEIKDLTNLQDKLKSANAKIMTSTNEEDTQVYKDVVLNAENEWSYSWTGLPIDNGAEIDPVTYYYYVLEDMTGIADVDKYTTSYSSVKSNNNTKIEYTINNKRDSITVQKQWFDEDGNEIVKYNEDGKLVDDEGNILAEDSDMYNNLEAEFNVYKKTSTKIVALGDSITDGYEECAKNDKCYPSKLAKLLNSDVINMGYSTQQIGYAPNVGIRSHISEIPNDANIICFIGGTNDIHQGGNGQGNPDEVYARFLACIEEIQTQTDNNAVIFVGSIPHFDFYKNGTLTTGGSWWPSQYQADDGKVANDLIDEYNAKIKAFAETTDNVYFVDVCSIVTDDDIRADGCHPNENGYTKIAKAFAESIDNNYTPPESQKIGSFTLNKGNNWISSFDIPNANNEYYYVREVTKTGWKVNYINNSQKVASGNIITVENQKVSEKTSITLEKTWEGDSPDDTARNGVRFALLRSTTPNVEDSWEQYIIKTPEPTKTDDKWTYIFGVDDEGNPTLPTKDINGHTYYYKFEEYALDGYNTTYGTATSDESQGLISIDGESAGILHITNTRQISLNIQKQWSDSDTNEHLMDTVKVQIYRSTNPNDVPDIIKNNLMLQVPESVSLGVNADMEVIVNKAITSAESDNENVTVSFEGNTLTISSNSEECTAKITVSDGIEEKTINVMVSAVEILLNGERNYTITAGDEVTLSATKEGETTFRVVSGDDVVGISGNKLTAKNGGTTAVISVTVDGVTIKQTITVNLSETFTLSGEKQVEMNETIKLSPDPNFGTFEWSSSDESVATVVNGEVKGLKSGNVTITATRNDGRKASVTIKVLEAAIEIIPNKDNRIDIASKLPEGLTLSDISSVKIQIIDIVKTDPYSSGMAVKFEGDASWSQQSIYENWNGASITGDINIEFDMANLTVNPAKSIYVYATNISCKIKIEFVPKAFSASYLMSPVNSIRLMADGEPVTLTGDPVGEPITIKQSDNWNYTVDNLDVYYTDENGEKHPYYYWAVETDEITGYTATYLFTDSDDNTSNCLNASQLGNGNIVIKNNKTVSEGVQMPSTGGEGTKGIKEIGMFIMLGSVASYIVIRRLSRRRRIR